MPTLNELVPQHNLRLRDKQHHHLLSDEEAEEESRWDKLVRKAGRAAPEAVMDMVTVTLATTRTGSLLRCDEDS